MVPATKAAASPLMIAPAPSSMYSVAAPSNPPAEFCLLPTNGLDAWSSSAAAANVFCIPSASTATDHEIEQMRSKKEEVEKLVDVLHQTIADDEKRATNKKLRFKELIN